MKLSIVIVNYNVKYFLEQCLISVKEALEGIDGEVFVVDNNSVDGSQQMLKERFPDINVILNEQNVGFAKANNQAMRVANGEYILLLNPDTVVESDTFHKVIDFMDSHPDAGGLGVKMVDGKGKFLPESKRSLPTPEVSFYKIFGLSQLFPKSKRFGKYHLSYLDENQTHEVEILAGAFMLMRKSVLDKVGLLDDTFFMYGEDIDLSYRIILGGYKNYYFPEARIIHYKGESTKKGSLNYVKMFYNAMKIFSEKHFSKKYAKTYSLIINFAIYFRAFIAVIERFIKKIFLPVFDFALIYIGFLLLKNYWEVTKFQGTGIYPDYYQWIIVPLYVLVWMFCCYLSGGYDKPVKLSKIVHGVSIGTVAILVVYALLNEQYRHSRFLIIIGAIWAILEMVSFRFILSQLKITGFKLYTQTKKRIAIIGKPDEVKRVDELLNQTGLNADSRVFIYSDKSPADNHKFVGYLSQLEEIIIIHKVNEIIFCARDINAKNIINTMSSLQTYDLEFKTAPAESVSIIGSNSINTNGELYFIDINTINKPNNKRSKRLIDIITSILFLVFSPILIFIQKTPFKFILDIFRVLSNKKSWVGYYAEKEEYYKNLPEIKSGILSPMVVIPQKMRTSVNPAEINLLYAKDYIPNNDVVIILKGIRHL